LETIFVFLIEHLANSLSFNDSERYFDTTVEFRGLENTGLAYLFKFLS